MKKQTLSNVFPALLLPFLAYPASSQIPVESTTGTAHPEQLNDTIQADHYVKPSRVVASQTNVPASAYQDSYPATGTAPEPVLLPRVANPAGEATPVPGPYTAAQSLATQPAVDPADGDIVLDVPTRPHELNRGTLLHARLREALSTQTTAEGATFTAELLADAGHHGEVMLPAGSLIRGHVSSVHGGKRISGGAAMHLRPDTISLPDGTLYRLDAQLTAVDGTQDLRVNDEGTVTLHSNAKAAAAVVGGVTATAAVTGAVIGGGVGAGVGAIVGAGVGTAVYLRRDIQENLPAGTSVIFALSQPLVLAPR